MARLPLQENLPGIVGLLAYRPETGRPLTDLADALLYAGSSLSRGERELIATYVSSRNDCTYCRMSHGAFAAAQLNRGDETVAEVIADPQSAPISPKLKALLALAGKVARDGKDVTDNDIAAARAAEATDLEIHDTVLIAAAFCMYNRYVDALAGWVPEDPALYAAKAPAIVEKGYRATIPA